MVHQIHNIVQIFGDDLLTIGLLVAVLRHIQNLLNDFDLVINKTHRFYAVRNLGFFVKMRYDVNKRTNEDYDGSACKKTKKEKLCMDAALTYLGTRCARNTKCGAKLQKNSIAKMR